EHAIGVALEDVHRVAECGGRGSVRVGHAELQEPTLHRRKQAHRAPTGLDLRAKQAVQHAQAGAAKVGRAVEAARYRPRIRETLLEVISHLSFKLYVLRSVEPYAAAETKEVSVVSVAEPRPVHECANLTVILGK